MTAHRESPIFICGPARSGTTMMRSCLNKHPSICIARETHYFEDLRPRFGDAVNRLLTGEERKACEDYFLALDTSVPATCLKMHRVVAATH